MAIAALGAIWNPWAHHHSHHKAKGNELLKALEKICAIALGALAFYVDFKLALTFGLVGTVFGIVKHLQHPVHHHHHGHASSSCSLGFIERVAGDNLPAEVSLLADFALTAAHIDHLPIMVPIVTLSLGGTVGRGAAHYASQVYSYLNPPVRHWCLPGFCH